MAENASKNSLIFTRAILLQLVCLFITNALTTFISGSYCAEHRRTESLICRGSAATCWRYCVVVAVVLMLSRRTSELQLRETLHNYIEIM